MALNSSIHSRQQNTCIGTAAETTTLRQQKRTLKHEQLYTVKGIKSNKPECAIKDKRKMMCGLNDLAVPSDTTPPPK